MLLCSQITTWKKIVKDYQQHLTKKGTIRDIDTNGKRTTIK
jgi:hypothetical protein